MPNSADSHGHGRLFAVPGLPLIAVILIFIAGQRGGLGLWWAVSYNLHVGMHVGCERSRLDKGSFTPASRLIVGAVQATAVHICYTIEGTRGATPTRQHVPHVRGGHGDGVCYNLGLPAVLLEYSTLRTDPWAPQASKLGVYSLMR